MVTSRRYGLQMLSAATCGPQRAPRPATSDNTATVTHQDAANTVEPRPDTPPDAQHHSILGLVGNPWNRTHQPTNRAHRHTIPDEGDMDSIGDEFLSRQCVLVIAPHADDETYGCAGAIARIKDLGGQVYVSLISVGSLGPLRQQRRRIRDAQGNQRYPPS